MDPTLKAAKRFLKLAAGERKALALERAREVESIAMGKSKHGFGLGHRWLRAFADAARMTAEAAALSRIATRRDLKTVLTD